MSEENKYSIAAMAERSARCKGAMDKENSEYFDSIKVWIRSCYDRLRAVEPDISAVLTLTKNMVGLGLVSAMNAEELLYGEVLPGSFAKGVCTTYRYKIALHLKGFVLDGCGDGDRGKTRLFYQYRAHTNNPSTFFGGLLTYTPDDYDLDKYARHLLNDDIVISKSRERMNEYMASVDNVIDNGLPAFIQKLCEFADKHIANE